MIKKPGAIPLSDFSLWQKIKKKNLLIDFELELTARCNNNCRHCYINLPPFDSNAQKKELTKEEISEIAEEAVRIGALSCLVSGGEPLLRDDFQDIYIELKKKGLLLSVFTNATLINQEHINLFRKYPPREIEVSVYGATKETYEKVTRIPGSFENFMSGVNLLMENGIKTRFKAMAMNSTLAEMPLIAEFCRKRTKDYFRFDPLLHLRFDGNQLRNAEIIKERLAPEQIAALDKNDSERLKAMQKDCKNLIIPQSASFPINSAPLFQCGAGQGSCSISYDGIFRLCSALWHPECVYDLKKGSLEDAYKNFVPQIRAIESKNRKFLEHCASCNVVNLCFYCPAHSYLETGKMDLPIDYFCKTACARAGILKKSMEE